MCSPDLPGSEGIGWVILATRFSLPVSTTHTITGALIGTGLVMFPSDQIRSGLETMGPFAKS